MARREAACGDQRVPGLLPQNAAGHSPPGRSEGGGAARQAGRVTALCRVPSHRSFQSANPSHQDSGEDLSSGFPLL